ncbi:MAG: MsnO8 family LLM class oxidoreductase [Ginsengibacter sp.]
MKLSIVDLSTVLPGETRHDALIHTIEVAQHIERLGFTRIWVAEHHGAGFVAGRAPEVLIAAIAANTKSIRVGSGSVLLNHYSSFKVAEVFCTLNELYPGRIDLGAGRATTGPVTDLALQQDRSKRFQSDSDQQIAELVAWLDDSFPHDHPFSQSPIKTLGEKPKLYLLGSSSWSASAAAALGLRYVVAGFINHKGAGKLLDLYRSGFKPATGESGVADPESILSVHVVCADTEEESRRQLAPVNVMYNNLSMGIIDGVLPAPNDALRELGGLPTLEKYVAGTRELPKFIGGDPESVQQQLKDIAKDFDVEEIMIQDMMTEHTARLHSYDLLSQLIKQE